MFRYRRAARSRREYELQPAADFLFAKRPRRSSSEDKSDAQGDGATRLAVSIAGQRMPFGVTRVDELRFSQADVPALTVAADPCNGVAVTGEERLDWSLRFCVQGEGDSEDDARQRLREISMVRAQGTVSLIAPRLLHREQPPRGRGELSVDAPAHAGLLIHASYAPVRVCDMHGPVRLTATHARATILDTTGQVDAAASVIDFSAARGDATLSADAEINMRLSAAHFEGTLLAWAQRCVRVVVPRGFRTPFLAIVSQRADFVCRTEFAPRVHHEKKGDLHYFTYSGDPAQPDIDIHLRSEQATIVIDSIAP